MQVQHSKYFADRVLYYASRAFANQLNKGEEYKHLKPVYFIGVLKFNKDDPTRLEGILEKWLFFLKYGSSNMEEEVIRHLPEAEFRQAVDITRKIAMDRQSMLEYDVADDVVRDLATREGESYDRGEAVGIEKGRVEGRIVEKVKIVHNLHASGMNPEDIAQNCELAIEEIWKLLSTS